MSSKNIFSTDSFHLASYLLSQSIPLVFTDKTNLRRVIFHFEDSESRVRLTSEFLAHKAQVEPHRLFSAQKDLKQIIYDSIRSP